MPKFKEGDLIKYQDLYMEVETIVSINGTEHYSLLSELGSQGFAQCEAVDWYCDLVSELPSEEYDHSEYLDMNYDADD